MGGPVSWHVESMKKLFLPLAALLLLSACTFTSDEEYIRCLQGFNDPGSGGGVPGGKAATVITAGAAGAAAALVLCEEPEITESPKAVEAEVDGDLSQPLEAREPLLVSNRPTASKTPPLPEPVLFSFDSRTLQFELDRAELPPGAEDTLASVVNYLSEFSEVNVTIAGHTCWLGSEIYNQTLSQQRAQAVADFIISQGISGDRLFVEAYGESRPIVSNQTDGGRRQNRRVEVIQR